MSVTGVTGNTWARSAMTKKLLLIPALLVVAAAGYWALQGREASDRGGDLTVYGKLDIREVNLAFNAAERIREILVQAAGRVAPGQGLAGLDRMRLDAALAAAEAAREAQAQVLARLQAGSRRGEIRRAEAQVAALQAPARSARSTQITYEGLPKLAAQKLSAPEEVDMVRAAADAAEWTSRPPGSTPWRGASSGRPSRPWRSPG